MKVTSEGASRERNQADIEKLKEMANDRQNKIWKQWNDEGGSEAKSAGLSIQSVFRYTMARQLLAVPRSASACDNFRLPFKLNAVTVINKWRQLTASCINDV